MNIVSDNVQLPRMIVLRAWQQTLETDPVSDEENFFDAGGNSILLVEFQRRISEQLNFKIPLREIFRNPTVAGLSGRIATMATNGSLPAMGGASNQALNLYCLPYAGCSARVYDVWQAGLPDSINVVPLELPGRGSRCTDHPLDTLPELLQDLTRGLSAGDRVPYSVFGHSFGAIIAYELTRYLVSQGYPGPRSLIVSACRAPHLATPEVAIFDRPDGDFKRGLRRVGGTPEELLENDELMELYIPVIRADYTILDNYHCDPVQDLSCPILGLYGDADPDADKASMSAWGAYTSGSFSLESIEGDHFFLHHATEQVIQRVGAHLNNDL
ncbi:alpha/beta fold hydrolase [Streptomyces vinaceus]|nr:alpha/beta fold hydrolase [Streptomyces vinaceus]